jgi:Flp pilus assembly pilin Flp
MVEYAFILILVSLVVLVALVSSGRQVISLYSNITGTLRSAGL